MWRRPWRSEPAGLKSSRLFTDTRAGAFDQVWTLPSLLGLAYSVQNLLFRMHGRTHPHTTCANSHYIRWCFFSTVSPTGLEPVLFNRAQVHSFKKTAFKKNLVELFPSKKKSWKGHGMTEKRLGILHKCFCGDLSLSEKTEFS